MTEPPSIYTTMIQQVNIPSGELTHEVGHIPPYYKYDTDQFMLMNFQKQVLKDLEEKEKLLCKDETFSRQSLWDYPLYWVPGFWFKTNS